MNRICRSDADSPSTQERGDIDVEQATIDLASRWKRLGGALIDAIIELAILFPVMIIMGIWEESLRGEGLTLSQQAVYFAIALAVFLALNGYLLYTKGQTIGKTVVKTKIVDLSGNLPPFGKLLVLRYLIPWLIAAIPIVGGLFELVNVLFIFGSERRCVHDYIAGTRVINA